MLERVATQLRYGKLTARTLAEACLARIADPAGEGSTTFLHTDPDLVRAMADHADRLRRAGAAPRYAGIPLSFKDLFDIAGQPTRGGSRVLDHAQPAAADAPVVTRLRSAGFLPIGRTNMTEFAFSGLGINPHHGTPRNPYDRATGRIPGGSSSGAAVSVTDGMALAGLGTDTGGSCRIPAALCGVVGYKPTAHRIPRTGVLPLSTTLDSVGPLAASVRDCALLDAILAGEEIATPTPRPVRGLRLAVPRTIVLDGMEPAVAASFDAALRRLRDAGAQVDDLLAGELAEIPLANAKGGFSAAEAYAWHRKLIAGHGAAYDQRILARLMLGQKQEAADYLDLIATRADLIRRIDAITAPYDALVMPTVPLVAPPIATLDDPAEYARVNMLLLRNTSFWNFLDRCSISLPCHAPGAAPVGLMLVGAHGADRALFAMAQGIEALVSPPPVDFWN